MIDCIASYTDRLCCTHGNAEADWLRDTIEMFWSSVDEHEYEFVDNVRLACLDIHEEMIAYECAKDQGCCGSIDKRLGPSPGGRTYVYGFNYGH